MLASFTATWVEQNQCPLHQSILLTQGPIHEIFMKKYWELAELENEVFLRWPFWIFRSAILNFFFASSHWKMQTFYMRYHFFLHYGWFFQNLGQEAVRTFMHTTVLHKRSEKNIENIVNYFWRSLWHVLMMNNELEKGHNLGIARSFHEERGLVFQNRSSKLICSLLNKAL